MRLFSGIRGEIIEALTRKYPLSVLQLTSEIGKQSGRKVSRQAVHLAVNTLINDQYLDKSNQSYKLSGRFIQDLEKVVVELKETYGKSPDSRTLLNGRNTQKIAVSSLKEMDAVWNNLLREILQPYPIPKHPYLQCVPHAWFSIAQFEEEKHISSLLIERTTGFYTRAAGVTKLDKWLARFYEGAKSQYLISPLKSTNGCRSQLSIFDDYIIEAEYPKGIAQRLDYLFESSSQISEIDLRGFISCVSSPAEIIIKVSRNRRRAKRLKASLFGDFAV